MKKIFIIAVLGIFFIFNRYSFAMTVKSQKAAEEAIGVLAKTLTSSDYYVKVLERHIQNPKTYSNVDAVVFWKKDGYKYISSQDSDKTIIIYLPQAELADKVDISNVADYIDTIKNNKLAPYVIDEGGDIVAIIFAMYPSRIQPARRQDGSLSINIVSSIADTMPFKLPEGLLYGER